MEETENKRFGKSAKGVAETAIVAYIAVKTFKATTAIARDAVCFVRARKANKVTEEA